MRLNDGVGAHIRTNAYKYGKLGSWCASSKSRTFSGVP